MEENASQTVLQESMTTESAGFPQIRNAIFLDDGRIDCSVNHVNLGWIPTTVSKDDDNLFFEHVVATVAVSKYAPPAVPSREQQRAEAISRVNQLHAGFLRDLTGNATVEERDTWKTKEDAARAFVDGTATDGQQSMIGYEAEGGDVDPIVLAQKIIEKAEGFQILIGLAAGLKAKARLAITQASSDLVSIQLVAPLLKEVFVELAMEVEAALIELKAYNS